MIESMVFSKTFRSKQFFNIKEFDCSDNQLHFFIRLLEKTSQWKFLLEI